MDFLTRKNLLTNRDIRLEIKAQSAQESAGVCGFVDDTYGTGQIWKKWQLEKTYVKSGEPDRVAVFTYEMTDHGIAIAGLEQVPTVDCGLPSLTISDPDDAVDDDGNPNSGWTFDSEAFTGITETTDAIIYGLVGTTSSWSTDEVGVYADWQTVAEDSTTMELNWTGLAAAAAGTPTIDLDNGLVFNGNFPSTALSAFLVHNLVAVWFKKLRFKLRLVLSRIPCVVDYNVRTLTYTNTYSGGLSETGDSEAAQTAVELGQGTWESDWIEVVPTGGQVKGLNSVILSAVPYHD